MRLSCGGTFRCGAESLTHLVRTLVHVREDRRNGAGLGLAGLLGFPGARVKMLDVVDTIIGGKDPDCGSTELRVDPELTRCQGSVYSLT